jgi:hypothetical protein
LTMIEGHLPFALRGLDSDKGSEFINAHLVAFCQRPAATPSSSRAPGRTKRTTMRILSKRIGHMSASWWGGSAMTRQRPGGPYPALCGSPALPRIFFSPR